MAAREPSGVSQGRRVTVKSRRSSWLTNWREPLMSNGGENSMVGPRNPQSPIGDPERLSGGITRQQYEDGIVHQVQVKRGDPARWSFDGMGPRCVWLGVYEEGDDLYLSYWIPGE